MRGRQKQPKRLFTAAPAQESGHTQIVLGVSGGLGRSLVPLLLGIGLTLFMVSDYFLVVYKYKTKRKRTLRLNTSCYFLGMMLVALSFSVLP